MPKQYVLFSFLLNLIVFQSYPVIFDEIEDNKTENKKSEENESGQLLENPLRDAVRDGNYEKLESTLVEYEKESKEKLKKYIDDVSFNGLKPLFFAVYEVGNTPIVSLLLKFGAREDSSNPLVMIALEKHQNREMARLLIESGADVHAPSILSKKTPLTWAVIDGNVELTEFIYNKITNGSDKKKCRMIAAKNGMAKKLYDLFEFEDIELDVDRFEKTKKVNTSKNKIKKSEINDKKKSYITICKNDTKAHDLIDFYKSLNLESHDGSIIVCLHLRCRSRIYLVPLDSFQESSEFFIREKKLVTILTESNSYYEGCLDYLSRRQSGYQLIQDSNSSIGVFEQAKKWGIHKLVAFFEQTIESGQISSDAVRNLFTSESTIYLANKAFRSYMINSPREALRLTRGIYRPSKRDLWQSHGNVQKLDEDLQKKWDELVANLMINKPQEILHLLMSVNDYKWLTEYGHFYGEAQSWVIDDETGETWTVMYSNNGHYDEHKNVYCTTSSGFYQSEEKVSLSMFFCDRLKHIALELKNYDEYTNSSNPIADWFRKQQKSSTCIIL